MLKGPIMSVFMSDQSINQSINQSIYLFGTHCVPNQIEYRFFQSEIDTKTLTYFFLIWNHVGIVIY